MTTIAPSDPVTQIAEALHYVRKARHFQGCCCFMYRNAALEAFCTPEEALWNKAVDRLLENIEAMR